MDLLGAPLNALKRRFSRAPVEAAVEGSFPDLPVLDLQYDGTGNVLLGRKRFAVGLDWEPTRPEEGVREQAERGQKAGYRRTLYAPFAGQRGFASHDRQQRRGSVALITAARSELLGPRWVGAFRINAADRFWWVGAVRDGEVYEDAIVPDDASARALLLDALDAPDWTSVIAPPDWQVSGTVSARIEQVLSLRSGVSLLPVDGRRDVIQRTIILSLIGAIGLGGYYVWSDMRRQDAEQASELARLRESIVRVDPRTHPWADVPTISEFVDTCTREIEAALFVVPGWGNGPIVCTASGREGVISTEWSRSGGRVPWLHAVTAHLPERVTLLEGGGRAELRREIRFAGIAPEEIDSPWDATRVGATVQSRFQTLGLDLTLRSRVRSVTTMQRQDLRAPVYNRHDLSIETSVAIGDYARLLSDVPALVPEALVYGVESGTWTLTAKIHHTPILPLPPT
jgi:hypothetical protein